IYAELAGAEHARDHEAVDLHVPVPEGPLEYHEPGKYGEIADFRELEPGNHDPWRIDVEHDRAHEAHADDSDDEAPRARSLQRRDQGHGCPGERSTHRSYADLLESHIHGKPGLWDHAESHGDELKRDEPQQRNDSG